MLTLKIYQQNALDGLDGFLRRARIVGPKTAFETQVGQGIPYQTDPFADVPCVCLRLPTGGGKTLLASHAVVHIARSWIGTDAPLALWLTPSDTIRSQTLEALQAAGHPYREALEAQYGAKLQVCDLEQVETISPHDVGHHTIVIVATIQSFRIEVTALRNVYAFSEAFEPHFRGIPPQQLTCLEKVSEADLARHPYLSRSDLGRVKFSLANWLALHNPIVIVDEAHNARTDLSFKALKGVNPTCILELTATPIPKKSNVLYHVSAQELQAEDMIKLPIELAEHPTGWESAVYDAIQRRTALEVEAQKEVDYIRPIVLFQAQPKDGEGTVDTLRAHLIEQQHIPAEQIAVATGSQRELEGVDLSSPACPIRFVITVEALKEGWDCPFAYVLCSLQTVKSAKDVEQLLGRVLRMPYARRRTQKALNRAYACVVAREWGEAAHALADRMIEKMGFEAMEVAAMVAPSPSLFDGAAQAQPPPIATPVLTVEVQQYIDVPADIARRINVQKTDGGYTVSISGGVPEQFSNTLQAAAAGRKQKQEIAESVERHNAIVAAVTSPAMRGIAFAPLPRLCLHDQGELELIERETLAGLTDIDLLAEKVELPNFNLVEQTNTFEITVDQQKVKVSQAEGSQLDLNAVPTLLKEGDLIRWLDQHLRQPFISQSEFLKYLSVLVANLLNERRFSLTGLIRSRFMLAQAIEKRVLDAHARGVRNGFRQLILDGVGKAESSFTHEFRFELDRYPARAPYYRGRWQFKKHYYPQIPDLKSEGEETDCAIAIDAHPKVRHWVRNLVGRPDVAFWLPTSTDYFYPDFVCELTDGRILVVEYKGAQYLGAVDTSEKQQVGDLWARTSKGKCLFLMAVLKDERGRGVRNQLDAAIG